MNDRAECYISGTQQPVLKIKSTDSVAISFRHKSSSSFKVSFVQYCSNIWSGVCEAIDGDDLLQCSTDDAVIHRIFECDKIPQCARDSYGEFDDEHDDCKYDRDFWSLFFIFTVCIGIPFIFVARVARKSASTTAVTVVTTAAILSWTAYEAAISTQYELTFKTFYISFSVDLGLFVLYQSARFARLVYARRNAPDDEGIDERVLNDPAPDYDEAVRTHQGRDLDLHRRFDEEEEPPPAYDNLSTDSDVITESPKSYHSPPSYDDTVTA